MSTFGYAGKILWVDLSSGKITESSSLEYSDKFLGGRGLAAKIYWDNVPPETEAFDEANIIVFACGPLAGLSMISSSRWTVCGKSPKSPGTFNYGSFGGTWGAEMKFAGYDAIVVQGKSDKPVYLSINDGTAELKDASSLWGKGAIEARGILKSEMGKSLRVVAIGPAGENMVIFSLLTADNEATGSAGLGAVMGSKKLKAIAVRGTRRKVNVAHPEKFKELQHYFRDSGRNFPEFLNRWVRDPFNEFKVVPGPEMKKDPCYGCLGRCPRKVYQAADGRKGKFFCHSAYFYQPWADRYYGDWNENPNDIPFNATQLCDDYGLEVKAVDLTISWLQACYEAGIITDESIGIPISKLGSMEFIETLVQKISFREGFGDLLAQGIDKAAEALGPAAKAQVEHQGYLSTHGADVFGPRVYIVSGLLYGMEPRQPIQQLHEVAFVVAKWTLSAMHGPEMSHVSTEVLQAIARRFWGSESAVDFSTYEGKALMAKKIQDRQYVKESLILCDFLWPVVDLESTDDHVGDPTLESRILSAVTGNEVSEEDLYKIGERVFNLQRAILVREGHRGKEFDTPPERCFSVPVEFDVASPDCLMPGKNGELISRKGAVVDREQFERMKDEYYEIRQWDVATGLQTRTQLEKLDLGDVADDLEKKELLSKGVR